LALHTTLVLIFVFWSLGVLGSARTPSGQNASLKEKKHVYVDKNNKKAKNCEKIKISHSC
jgi:hypothetical protein